VDVLLRIRRLFGRDWPILAIASFYLYLAVHAMSGSQGLAQWMEYEKDKTRLAQKIEHMEARKSELEAQKDRLSAEHLDLDDLDTLAREFVFLSDPDEVTIWLYQ